MKQIIIKYKQRKDGKLLLYFDVGSKLVTPDLFFSIAKGMIEYAADAINRKYHADAHAQGDRFSSKH